MKRIYGAVFLLLGMVLFILASALYVQVFTGSALQILDEANAAYANAEYQACGQQLHELNELCLEHKLFLHFFVRREIAEELQKNIKGLPAYNTADSPNEYYYAADMLRSDIMFLRQSFLNVF